MSNLYTTGDVAEALDVSRSTVIRYTDKYNIKTKDVKRGKRVDRKYTKESMEDLRKLIKGDNSETSSEDAGGEGEGVDNTILSILKEQLESKDRQLEAKDEQIASILQKLENQQILLKDLQARVPMLKSGEGDEQKTMETSKKTSKSKTKKRGKKREKSKKKTKRRRTKKRGLFKKFIGKK